MAICIQVILQQIIFIFEMEAIFVYCRFYINLLNILIIKVDKYLPYICSRVDQKHLMNENEK